MANNNTAEIELVLNTKGAIKTAKETGPKIAEALKYDADGNRFLETQQRLLRENLKDAKLLAEIKKKDGTVQDKLAKGLRPDGLAEYESKLKNVYKLIDDIKQNEADLAKNRADQEASKKTAKSLASKIGGAKDKDQARANWEAEKANLADLKTAEQALIAEQNKLNASFDEEYKKIEYIVKAMENVSSTVSENQERVNDMETTYNAIHQGAEKTATAQEQVSEATEAAAEQARKEAEAINSVVAAEEKLASTTSTANAGVTATPKAPTAKGGTEPEESIIGASKAASEAKLSFVELIEQINELRLKGKDASAEFAELQTRLRSFDTSTANAGELDDYLTAIDASVKLIKKDLGDTAKIRLNDVFNELVAAAAPARQAFRDIQTEAKKTGNDVVKSADTQSKVAQIYATVAAAQQARVAEQQRIQAILDAQQQKEVQDKTAYVAAMVALGEQLKAEEEQQQQQELQSRTAYVTAMAALSEQLRAEEEAAQRQETQAQQNYILALNATLSQERQQFQDTMQAVIDTTDRVENAMRTDSEAVNIAELTRRLSELKQAKKALEDYGLPREMDSRYELLGQLIAQVTQQIKDYGKSVEDTASSSAKAGEASKQMAKDTSSGLSGISTLINTTKKGFSSLSKIADKTKSSFDGMARNMKSNFKHMLSSITKYVFGFRSLFFLVRRLRKYIGEGIKGMAQFNGGNNSVNRNISQLITSLEYLKNAWATAFSPILDFITPWLSALIDKLASVGNAFSRFLGNLLGISKVFQAVKGPTKNYAKSLDKAGKSAGGASKKQKELNDRLADFDVLHVLGKDNPNKNSGGGSGSGGDDENKKRNNKLWDFAKVGNDIKKWIKQMWQDADFTELGEKLSEKLKTALQNLNKKLPEMLQNAGKIGKSIATFLNGLFSDPELFTELGKAIANLGNLTARAVSEFFANYDKGSIGSAIANFFKGVFENYSWKMAGSNLGEFVTTFFTELATLFREFPVEEFISGLKDFLEGVDWGSVIKSLFDFFAGAAGLIGKILTGLGDLMGSITSDDIIEAFSKIDWAKVAEGLGALISGLIYSSIAGINIAAAIVKAILEAIGGEELKKGMEEGDFGKAGKALIDGLAKGIGEAFNNAVNWTADYIVKPIVEGFKTLFKIHSPSEVTAEWGMFLIEGLANGLSDNIKKITEVWENIKTTITTIWDNIKLLVLTSATTFHDNVVKVFEGLKDALKGPAQGILNVAGGIANGIIKALNAGINAINKFLGKIEFPDWLSKIPGVSFLAGKKVDFGLKTLSTVQVPKLAQGAVIPPNREFMAVLGDQSHGTNIEAPLDTIKQAVAEVMANNNNAEVIRLLQQLIGVVESKNLVIGDKEIGKANARYNNQQRIIRGTSF